MTIMRMVMRMPIPIRAPVDFFFFPPLVFLTFLLAGLFAVFLPVLPLGLLALFVFFRGEGGAVSAALLWGRLGIEEDALDPVLAVEPLWWMERLEGNPEGFRLLFLLGSRLSAM